MLKVAVGNFLAFLEPPWTWLVNEVPGDQFALGEVPRLHPLCVRVQRGQEVDQERIAVEVDFDEAPGLG